MSSIADAIDKYSREVNAGFTVSNTYKAQPFMQLLLREDADRNKEGRDIGLPGLVISGNPDLNGSDMTQFATADRYTQDFDTGNTHNSKSLAMRDTEVVDADPYNNSSEDQSAIAEWRRSEIQTIITVWKSDEDAAKAKMGADPQSRGRAVLDLRGTAVKKLRANHITDIAKGLILGTGPRNQDVARWEAPLPLQSVCSTSNVYARLDRNKSKNLQWRGTYVASTANVPKTSLKSLVDYAKYQATLGNGVTHGYAAMGRQSVLRVCMGGADLFGAWRDEAEGRQGGIVTAEQAKMIEFGFTDDIIKYGDTLAICEPNMTDNTAVIWNPRDFTFAFEQGKKMALSNWIYPPSVLPGQKQAYSCTMTSSYFFVCHNPLNQIWFA